MDYKIGHLMALPYLIKSSGSTEVDRNVVDLISMSKTDWDSFETSWNFIQHPLLSKIDEHNRKSPPKIDTISDMCQKSAKFRRRINKYG